MIKSNLNGTSECRQVLCKLTELTAISNDSLKRLPDERAL